MNLNDVASQLGTTSAVYRALQKLSAESGANAAAVAAAAAAAANAQATANLALSRAFIQSRQSNSGVGPVVFTGPLVNVPIVPQIILLNKLVGSKVIVLARVTGNYTPAASLAAATLLLEVNGVVEQTVQATSDAFGGFIASFDYEAIGLAAGSGNTFDLLFSCGGGNVLTLAINGADLIVAEVAS